MPVRLQIEFLVTPDEEEPGASATIEFVHTRSTRRIQTVGNRRKSHRVIVRPDIDLSHEEALRALLTLIYGASDSEDALKALIESAFLAGFDVGRDRAMRAHTE